MKVADITIQIYQSLNEPTDITLPVIAYWIRAQIGALNSAINTKFYLDTNLEIIRKNPDNCNEIWEIGVEEVSVLEAMYAVKYLDKKIRENMVSYTSAPVIEVTDDGHTVRLASSTQIGQNLYNTRRQFTDELKAAITAYKTNKAQPRQVAGTDTTDGIDNSLNITVNQGHI